MPRGGARARSGPPKKATELKVLEGTWRKDRDAGRPTVDPGAFPAPPAHLNDDERVLWRELEQHCAQWAGASDRLAIEGAVSVHSLILRNRQAMAATPDAGAMLTVRTFIAADGSETAEVKENPLVKQQVALWRELRGYIAILGLSPADRARVRVKDDGKPASKWAGVLKQR